MPELPEVETTRRGIAPHIQGRLITELIVRNSQLRWPVPFDLAQRVQGQRVKEVTRRAKYLFLHLDSGSIIIHLGMSGSLSLVQDTEPAGKHDHLELHFEQDIRLRYTDPRRFGCWLWTEDTRQHPLLAHLGPEPLEAEFNAEYLYQKARKRRQAVKPFIMDNSVVVGVGNIYATEALFLSGIDPRRPAHSLSERECQDLVGHIRQVLAQAIEQGGTTLRDFIGGDGRPGYFQQQLQVYGRSGQTCPRCHGLLTQVRLGQRTSVYCPECQH
ncbi:DNA-(apurinic or apyrimidinic site) lyase [Azomonas agilis]|uniref:Formamidopyrimidine-DNA glycosylase n=1 Tax=Azomonas agilis TaxID=116849 RepID=A0A562HZK4_9GAMM|nr:bifunctional DNA-formamidopyrimidine glycosylase/DNA-(apurinic or apyrimidinic site) lyase [Azomonas agilis]TWH64219.1 DNA-(apurinic or apyrimidinic site) lyase [Azomonas agilis]